MWEDHLNEGLLQGIVENIRFEIERAVEKHPRWPSDLLRQIMIVTEEMGEAQQAALNYIEETENEGQRKAHEGIWKENLNRLSLYIDDEMEQVAAMAIRFLYHKRLAERDAKKGS